MQAQKRDRQGHFKPRGGGGPKPASQRQPIVRTAYTPMFENFRDELDRHYDRKERIVKASRDITALSKKIIFSLQRVRKINGDLPKDVEAETQNRLTTVSALLAEVATEVQGLNRHRYGRQLMCVEELVEALSFAHYLRHQRLMSYDEAVDEVSRLCLLPATADAAAPQERDKEAGDDDGTAMEGVEATEAEGKSESLVVGLTEDDYLMGVFDLSGEMMRFAITAAALSGELAASSSDHGTPRTILADIQELGSLFEMLPQRKNKSYQIKLATLRTSVLKVENMGYGLKVRGSERPKGWMPDTSAPGEPLGDDVDD